MSGYWSFRGPGEQSAGGDDGGVSPQASAPTATKVSAVLQVLPTAIEFAASLSADCPTEQQQHDGSSCDDCDDSWRPCFPTAAKNTIDAEEEAEDHNATDGIVAIDITPSIADSTTSTSSSSVRDYHGDFFATGEEQTTTTISMAADTQDSIQRDWWLSRLRVDTRPLDLGGDDAALKDDNDDDVAALSGPQPTVDRGVAASDEQAEASPEELAIVRQFLRAKTGGGTTSTTEGGGGRLTGTVGRPRPPPRPTVAVAPSLHTAARGVAGRRTTHGSSSTTNSCVHHPIDTAAAVAGPLTHSRPPPPAPRPSAPSFVSRMEQRAAVRQAAREDLRQLQQRQHQQQAGTTTTNHDSIMSEGVVTDAAAPPPPPQPHSPFWPRFAELVAVMAASHNSSSSSNASAISDADRHVCVPHRMGPAMQARWERRHLAEQRREIALVAAHYSACRAAHAALGRWRRGTSRAAERRQHRAAQQTALASSVSELSCDEAARRQSAVYTAEAEERCLLLEARRRQTVMRVALDQRRRAELIALRWHFVSWVAFVVERRAAARTAAYRRHLLRCATEALRGFDDGSRYDPKRSEAEEREAAETERERGSCRKAGDHRA